MKGWLCDDIVDEFNDAGGDDIVDVFNDADGDDIVSVLNDADDDDIVDEFNGGNNAGTTCLGASSSGNRKHIGTLCA